MVLVIKCKVTSDFTEEMIKTEMINGKIEAIVIIGVIMTKENIKTTITQS